VTDAGPAEIVKSRARTVSVIADVCVVAPLVALTVRGYVPPDAVVSVLIVSCELPAPATIAGVNVADPTVAGKPPTDSATSPVNPFWEPTPTVNPAAVPALTVCADGVAVSVKSGGAGS